MGMLLFDWKMLILALLPMGCICVDSETLHRTNCVALNVEFSEANRELVSCVLKHNEDGTFCEDCAPQYAIFISKYNLLVGSETDADGTTCRSRFVDNNQLSLVETIYANAKHIWEIGSCSGKTNNSIRYFQATKFINLLKFIHRIDCFEAKCDFANYTTDSCQKSNHTIEFENQYDIVIDCTGPFKGNHKSNETCIKCADKYEELNKIYNNIRLKTVDKFCFDIKDKVGINFGF